MGKNIVPDPTDPNALKPVGHGERSNLPLDRVTDLIIDAYAGATERHIEVGDGFEMMVIRAPDEASGQVTMEVIRRPLKRD
jgi:20S proteasome subunit beta 6